MPYVVTDLYKQQLPSETEKCLQNKEIKTSGFTVLQKLETGPKNRLCVLYSGDVALMGRDNSDMTEKQRVLRNKR